MPCGKVVIVYDGAPNRWTSPLGQIARGRPVWLGRHSISMNGPGERFSFFSGLGAAVSTDADLGVEVAGTTLIRVGVAVAVAVAGAFPVAVGVLALPGCGVSVTVGVGVRVGVGRSTLQ